MFLAIVFASASAGYPRSAGAQEPLPPTAKPAERDPVLAGVSLSSAEALFWEGALKYKAGDYRAAVALFEQSYGLRARPELLFNIAQSYRFLGECEPALSTYQRYLRELQSSEAFSVAQHWVTTLKGGCAPKLPPGSAVPPESAVGSAVSGPSWPRSETVAGLPSSSALALAAPRHQPQLWLAADEPASYWTGQRIAGWSAIGAALAAGVTAIAFDFKAQNTEDEIRQVIAEQPSDAGDRLRQLELEGDRADLLAQVFTLAAVGLAATGAVLVALPEALKSQSLRQGGLALDVGSLEAGGLKARYVGHF